MSLSYENIVNTISDLTKLDANNEQLTTKSIWNNNCKKGISVYAKIDRWCDSRKSIKSAYFDDGLHFCNSAIESHNDYENYSDYELYSDCDEFDSEHESIVDSSDEQFIEQEKQQLLILGKSLPLNMTYRIVNYMKNNPKHWIRISREKF
jgi:hypothetical protein